MSGNIYIKLQGLDIEDSAATHWLFPSSHLKFCVAFSHAGKARRWDAVQAHASVAVVLYHRDWQAFVVVRQFRPAVYAVKWRAAKAAGQPPPPFTEGNQTGHAQHCFSHPDKASGWLVTYRSSVSYLLGQKCPPTRPEHFHRHVQHQQARQ